MSETSNKIAPADYLPDPSWEDLKAVPSNYRINIEDIIYCIDVLQLSRQQTADRLKCSVGNITQRLQAYGYQPAKAKRSNDKA